MWRKIHRIIASDTGVQEKTLNYNVLGNTSGGNDGGGGGLGGGRVIAGDAGVQGHDGGWLADQPRGGGGGRGRVSAGDAGVQGHNAGWLADQPRGGGGGRVSAGDAGFQGHDGGWLADHPRGGGGRRLTGGPELREGNVGQPRYNLLRLKFIKVFAVISLELPQGRGQDTQEQITKISTWI